MIIFSSFIIFFFGGGGRRWLDLLVIGAFPKTLQRHTVRVDYSEYKDAIQNHNIVEQEVIVITEQIF